MREGIFFGFGLGLVFRVRKVGRWCWFLEGVVCEWGREFIWVRGFLY